MLIQRSPDVYEKLHHLAGMATDDILAPPSAEPRDDWRDVAQRGGRTPLAGVYRAAMPGGKRIALLRVMFTDHCIMDCYYCPNSHWVPRRRYGFKVDELARLFDDMHRRLLVDGLFLSSGIFKDPDHTQERMLAVVETLRTKYDYQGYIHLKVMPGINDASLLDAAQRLGTRLSINLEQPTSEHLGRVSKMKRFNEGMLRPMARIKALTDEHHDGAVGQVTQLVVGAADESDWDIHVRQRQLYREMAFKRVYYSAFRPIKHTPLEEHPPTPAVREHRLYQLDWLTRVYGYTDGELALAFNADGFLDTRVDPKTRIAVEQPERYPVDVHTAGESDLVRVPGIGPVSAERIVQHRRTHRVTHHRELEAMGVVLKRALPFLRFPGHRPARATQGELVLFPLLAGQRSTLTTRSHPHASRDGRNELHRLHAAAGCAGCPLRPATCGMPRPSAPTPSAA